MGSRSVTYHPAEVTFPPSRSSDPGGCKADDLGHIPRWHTHPETVTHPGTNRARRGLTSFMQRMPLTTTPRRQQAAASLLFCLHTLQRSSAYTAAVLENNTMHTSVSKSKGCHTSYSILSSPFLEPACGHTIYTESVRPV